MFKDPPANSSKLLVVLTTLPNLEVAKILARALVEKRLAACAQLTGRVQSIYRWEGKLCEEFEIVLSAKTTVASWREIVAFIRGAHPYGLPEILAFTPEQYEEQYGKWVQSEVNSQQ
jgi:periplasmic divalent cation tolerance protein